VAVCAGVGVVAGGVLALVAPWELAVLTGWMSTGVLLLTWIWLEIGRLDAAGTAAVATSEDDSRTAARIVLVVASVVSLIVVVAALHHGAGVSTRTEIALTVAALAGVVTSWLVVHTMFVLRYAHLYYGGDAVGGLVFPGDEAPNYRDFAYLGFTVGMTFQVSDTEVTEGSVRATVLRHSLLSYLFGTAIIASTINVLAGLVR
jgi:uncharacterized membrane protein